MKKLINIAIILTITASLFIVEGCNTIKNIASSANDLKNLQFKLGNADNFSVNSVPISKLRSVSDISVADGLKLAQCYANKTLPINFNLNVLATNPNKSTSTTNAKSNLDAVISVIDWVLLIDDKETINGRVNSPITIPTSNQSTTIPITIGLDLMKFFGDKGYSDLINLALAIGGENGSTSRVKLKMRPTVSVSGFPLSYPNYITVIDKEFRSK